MAPLLLAFTLVLLPQQVVSDVPSLFKAFRNTSDASYPLKKPKDVIRLYATDDINTKICFISGDVVYIYSNGRVTRPLYAKAFNVKAVNRITYQKSETGGAFLIWIDDEMTLSIGA